MRQRNIIQIVLYSTTALLFLYYFFIWKKGIEFSIYAKKMIPLKNHEIKSKTKSFILCLMSLVFCMLLLEYYDLSDDAIYKKRRQILQDKCLMHQDKIGLAHHSINNQSIYKMLSLPLSSNLVCAKWPTRISNFFQKPKISIREPPILPLESPKMVLGPQNSPFKF